MRGSVSPGCAWPGRESTGRKNGVGRKKLHFRDRIAALLLQLFPGQYEPSAPGSAHCRPRALSPDGKDAPLQPKLAAACVGEGGPEALVLWSSASGTHTQGNQSATPPAPVPDLVHTASIWMAGGCLRLTSGTWNSPVTRMNPLPRHNETAGTTTDLAVTW